MSRFSTIVLFFFMMIPAVGLAHDWPMWRFDHQRSASTPEQLGSELYLQWQVNYSPRIPVWDDPLNQNLMQFDRIFEPVVAGNKLFIGFNDQDKVVALDLDSGKEVWHFYADGPVRLPLAVNKNKIYFTGDDGFCYCLNTSDGSLVWKRLLAPSENKLLGNKRLISMWPARGGIVIKDDMIYTAASIFPLMGTFIYALDAETGQIIWKNEGTGSNYILQPHRSPAFADVAPQGPFTISGDKLLVAGGRSVPAAFDLKTGEELYYQLAASGKTGGAFTCAGDHVFFNHHRLRMTVMYDSETGDKLVSDAGEYPVIEGNTFYFSGINISAARLNSEKKLETLWNSDISATNDLIKAGDCLYAADSSGIKAVKLLADNTTQVIWNYRSEKNIERLVAANGKLIAVTGDGSIMVFGNSPVADIKKYSPKQISVNPKPGKSKSFIGKNGADAGYCLVIGGGDVQLLSSLIKGSSLNMVVYEKDAARVQFLREYFDKAGVTAERMSFLHFGNQFPQLPKYFSSLTIISDISYVGHGDSDLLEQVYESTRPYGGKVVFLEKGKVKVKERLEKTVTGLKPGRGVGSK